MLFFCNLLFVFLKDVLQFNYNNNIIPGNICHEPVFKNVWFGLKDTDFNRKRGEILKKERILVN